LESAFCYFCFVKENIFKIATYEKKLNNALNIGLKALKITRRIKRANKKKRREKNNG